MNKIEITDDEKTMVENTKEGSIVLDEICYYIWCGELYLNFYPNDGYADMIEFTVKDTDE